MQFQLGHSASCLWIRCKLSGLFQHRVCLPAAMLPAMMVVDSVTLWKGEPHLNAFFYNLPWLRCFIPAIVKELTQDSSLKPHGQEAVAGVSWSACMLHQGADDATFSYSPCWGDFPVAELPSSSSSCTWGPQQTPQSIRIDLDGIVSLVC